MSFGSVSTKDENACLELRMKSKCNERALHEVQSDLQDIKMQIHNLTLQSESENESTEISSEEEDQVYDDASNANPKDNAKKRVQKGRKQPVSTKSVPTSVPTVENTTTTLGTVPEDTYYHNFNSPLGNCCYAWCNLQGHPNDGQLFLVDTGAMISILPTKIYNEIDTFNKSVLEPSYLTIRAGNSSKCNCDGIATVEFKIENFEFTHKFYVCNDASHPILGIDFMEKSGMSIDPAKKHLQIENTSIPYHTNKSL